MEDRDKILDYTKPVRLPDDCSKNRKNFTQGYYYREIGRYKNVVPSEFQWAAEDKLINKTTYEELKCQLPDSPRSTFLMVFSPDGKKVASTHGNHNVYVTDLTTGKNIQTLSGHPRTPWCIAFHPSSNQILATGCLGGQVRVWDLHGGSEVWTAESQTVIASLAFHPVDRMLVIATYNELHFWDWSQPEPFAKCSTKSGREKVRYVSFDRLGNKLITGIANPVNVPSQWDRINVSCQPPMTSSTATTTNTTSSAFNSTPPTSVVSSQSNDQGRSITSWYRASFNCFDQLVSISRNTPTIDRGTDPMDLLDLRSNRNNNSEGSTSNPSPSTSNPQVNSSSPLRFKITRSACRFYRPLSCRERLQIHSSVFRRLSSRSSHSSNSSSNSTSVSQNSVFTNPTSSPPSASASRDTYIPRLRHCAFSLSPSVRTWCSTLSPETSPSLFTTTTTSQSTTPSEAVTNTTFTSFSDRGIFSTRESNSSISERNLLFRPYRLLFDDINDDHTTSQRETQSEPERESSHDSRSNLLQNLELNEGRANLRNNLTLNSPESTRSSSRDLGIHSPEAEIDRELQSSGLGLRRQETESTESNRESPYNSELFRNNRSSIFQLIPVNLRNVSPVRRFRDDANSDGELTESSRRENNSLPQSLMHPRPVPRFQLRSRLFQDQQSQLHLLTNRETHGLNLQNNQNLRRQLSFRPGGQFVLSRHSNSPFQPRVPHHSDSSTQLNSSLNARNSDSRLELSHRSSCSTSTSSITSEPGTSSSSSTGNTFSLSSVPSNLSFTGESSHQLPEQINRRLFDRVKMLLRDRIQNSSENASTDSTVNYSRISGESETEIDLLDCEENYASRGLGPRGEDPMLSSVSENLISSNELLRDSESSSPISGNLNSAPSSSNSLNMSHSDILDSWETETDSSPFSIYVPFSLNNVYIQDPPSTQESTQNETESAEPNQTPLVSNSGAINNSNPSSPELSMRQGIQLLSLHIENMQRLCWARIEIMQLQKIRRMWEDLTNQIRQLHNIIQNRTLGMNSSSLEPNETSNSGSDIPNMRNLAIRSSPVSERNREFSTSNDPNKSSLRNKFGKLVETKTNESANEERDSNPFRNSSFGLFQNSKHSSTERNVSQNEGERSDLSSSRTARNETEEPQPGPSGLSTPSTSGGVRNSILQLEYRVYKLLRDIIQKFRRRKEAKDLGMSSGSQRCAQSSGGRNSLRAKLRSHRFSRFDSSIPRSRALSRELEGIWQTWRNEKSGNKTSQPKRSSESCDANEPSTSTPRSPVSNDACQSCGQKRKLVKELYSKKRNIDSSKESGPSGSASKILKNNVGERCEVPNTENTEGETSSGSSSQAQESSANDLLKQMLQTMETMLHFQREAFQSSRGVPKPRSAASSGEDSDSDQNEPNRPREVFPSSSPRRGTRESVANSMLDIAQHRAKRLLGYMVKSLNQYFGKNFRNLNQVLDEQIFSLYMLLDLALELTDLLLEQLNARSHDLERNWAVDNPGNRGRSWVSSRPGISERNRERSRRSYLPLYPTREDSRNRFSANPYLRSLVGLISARHSGSGTSNSSHERFSSGAFSSNFRRKKQTARMSTTSLPRWYYRRGRMPFQAGSSSNSAASNRPNDGNSLNSRYRNFCSETRLNGENNFGLRGFNYEINNNSNNNDTNNNYSSTDDRNYNSFNNNNNNNNSGTGNGNSNPNNNSSSSNPNSTNTDNRSTVGGNSSNDISNNNNNNNNSNNNNNNSFLNYYFPNSGNSNGNSESGNNIIILTGLSSGSDSRNNSTQSGSNVSFLNQNSLPPLRSMELTISRNEGRDSSLRDERPIFWIRYGGNNETSGPVNNRDSQSRVSSFTVPIVQVNNVPVSDVSMLNQPRHRPQSPVPRVSEDIWRWRALRPRYLHPIYGGPNPFDDQDSNDLPENIHYYRGSAHLGVYTLDPMIITDAPMSAHHRIQAWDFSKMNIPDISDREVNGVVPECKIHNDASVDVSNDGHLLVTLLPSGRLSVTTMLGVYSLDWSSLGQLLYRTSFEQNAVSVSLSPTNRHLVVGLASRPVILRDRTNMAQIFRLEGGRPSPHGGSWQSGRGRLVHMRDLEQTREMNSMSLNCIRWAPGAGQGLVYGTNTGQLKVLR